MTEIPTSRDVAIMIIALNDAVDDAYVWLDSCEQKYALSKLDYELVIANTQASLIDGPRKLTVPEKDAVVKIECGDKAKVHAVEAAVVQSAQRNIQRLRLKSDLVRTLAASVRTSMELS